MNNTYQVSSTRTGRVHIIDTRNGATVHIGCDAAEARRLAGRLNANLVGPTRRAHRTSGAVTFAAALLRFNRGSHPAVLTARQATAA